MDQNSKTFLAWTVIVIAVIWLIGYIVPKYSVSRYLFSEPFDANLNGQAKQDGYNVRDLSPLFSVIAGSDFVGLPDTIIPPWEANENKYGESDVLDGEMGNAGLEFNLCSKSCCSAQYPNGIKMKPDPFVCDSKDKFSPSSYTCNNAYQDSGCVCMTDKQSKFLDSRGGNA